MPIFLSNQWSRTCLKCFNFLPVVSFYMWLNTILRINKKNSLQHFLVRKLVNFMQKYLLSMAKCSLPTDLWGPKGI
jgi:hypothetical protein